MGEGNKTGDDERMEGKKAKKCQDREFRKIIIRAGWARAPGLETVLLSLAI